MNLKKLAKQLNAGTFAGLFTKVGDSRVLPITFSKRYNTPRWAGIALDKGWEEGRLAIEGRQLVCVPEKVTPPTNPDLDYAAAVKELRPKCMDIANGVCRAINERIPPSYKSVKYARQQVLEDIIQILTDRV